MTTLNNNSSNLHSINNHDRKKSENVETGYRNMENDSLEDNHDDFSLAPSIASSVLSAEGIYDPTGFACICLVIFLGDMTRGVFFPSLWLFVEHLGGSAVTLGYAVAAFSFGRILVNPVFGSWSHTIGYTKTLLISCSLLFLGTLLYAVTYLVGRPECLLAAQTVLGVGSGTLGVSRAFVAEITPQRDRTTYMAWLTAMQYAGFTVTPIAGAFFNYIFRDATGFLNMFTAPALFMGFIVLGTIAILLTFFQGRVRMDQMPESEVDVPPKKKSERRQEIERVANEIVPVIGLSIYDCCILGCMLLNISTKGSIAAFETLGIKIAESHFGLLSTRAGLWVGICGACGVASLLSMGYLSQLLSDVQLIAGGILIMSLSSALFMTLNEPEQSLYDDYVVYSDDAANSSWKYCVSIFLMYSIGYPIGHTAVIGLFSKVIGRRPQGTLQGWFASAGSLARIIFPLLSGYILHGKDARALFEMITFVLILSTAFVVYSSRTLTLLSH
ncbi:MFS transporter, ceroid-lipofuscinosis neuronal protein 7 [Fistulifera solaris]|uniref:MFS transporter, ceroid-lipofuscinosis neuronal protein 7 n=1 Tax=Fistulifera solaris TaxID=1519565 RepID=A0A1Z5KA55_FISSO|nr:MFS transporter, ceroid-lipofuscinosis neuronal protein 7 [Fistulifera solaris]|eukprot:GAX23150.1 MFS transporter, ceroid-lipofuscinosis neuronal protein 7 [Fistulifera solaris]